MALIAQNAEHGTRRELHPDVEPRWMVALLFALLLGGLTAAALLVAGLVAAAVTGVVALNLFVVILSVARRRGASQRTEPPAEVVKTHPITGPSVKAPPAPSDVTHIQ